MTKKRKTLGLANMHKELSEAVSSSAEESMLYLQEQGIDYKSVVSSGVQEINKYLILKRAKENKLKKEASLEKAIHLVREYINQHKNQSKDVLIALLNQKAPAFQFRNLEKITDDDIKDILMDVDLLKFLEEAGK
jgi:hypothetical protein